VAFVALGTLMWLSNFTKRAAASWGAVHSVSLELAQQKEWLANRDAIEAGANRAVKNLDPVKTLDDSQLVSELNALARENHLKYANDTPQNERSGGFAVHTVQITLQTLGQDPRAEWDSLRRFHVELSRRSPYIGIEQFSLAANRTNPGLLTASLKVSSVEIIRN